MMIYKGKNSRGYECYSLQEDGQAIDLIKIDGGYYTYSSTYNNYHPFSRYIVRTRNRNGSKVASMLLGTTNERVYYNTDSLIVGRLVWVYMKVVSIIRGGGRTYLEKRSSKESKNEYKNFYL